MKVLVGIAAFAIVLGACGGGAPAATVVPSASAPAAARATTTPAPVTLKIGQVGGLSDAAIYIADAKGLFKAEGITLEATSFASAAQMVAPLGTGELQVGGGAVSAGLFNAIDRGVGIVIVADKGNLSPGSGYEAMVVRSELAATVKGPKDLKGRTVAISALDITPEVTVDTYLRRGGLTVKDVNLIALPHADMLQALKNGSIDVGVPIEPHVSRIVAAGVGTILTRNDAVMPGEQTAVILFSDKFAKDRELALRFMRAYVQAARFYNDAFVKKDAAKRAEAIEILSAATKVDKALFETMAMPGIDPTGKVNVESLREIQSWFVGKGSQKKAIDLAKAVDLSFADEAVRQLPGYR